MKRRCYTGRTIFRFVLHVVLVGYLLENGEMPLPVAFAKSVKAKKSVRLRGHRQTTNAKASEPASVLTQVKQESSGTTSIEQSSSKTRKLTSMWENTETAYHVEFGDARNSDVQADEKAVIDVIVDGELTSDTDLAPVRDEEQGEPGMEPGMEEPPSIDHLEMEQSSADDPYEVDPMKEEPKELYVHPGGKSYKTNKVKGSPKSAVEPEPEPPMLPEPERDPEPEEIEEVDEEEEDYDTVAEPMVTPNIKEEEVSVEEEEYVEEEPEERPKDGKDDKDEYISAEPQHTEPVSEDEELASPEEEYPPAKESGKGKAKGRSRRSPLMAEIGVGVHYTRPRSSGTPNNQDYSALARITSHVCDYIFRNYFEDIEDLRFLSTDQLAIYTVIANDYVEFTVAAYFDGDSSILPNESRLTDIVVRSLQDGSTYYDYYLFLLENLGAGNSFASVTSIELNVQSSHLTGPGGHLNPPPTIAQRGTSRIFKVFIPIVVVLLASVVGAMVYMNWVESHELPEGEGEILNKVHRRRQDPRKRLHQNRRYRHRHYQSASSSDGDHSTLPSLGDQSSYIADDATSISESSDRFVDEMVPSPPRRARQVRVSPKVRYRTFTPADFSSRVDFEEVNLQDDVDDDDDCPIPLEPKVPAKKSPAKVATTTQLEPQISAKKPLAEEEATTTQLEPKIPAKKTLLEPQIPSKETPAEEEATITQLEPQIPTRKTPAEEEATMIQLEPQIPTRKTPAEEEATMIQLEPQIPTKKTPAEEEATMIQLMDDFAKVLNSAPFGVDSTDEPPASKAPPGNDQLSSTASIPWDEASRQRADVFRSDISRTRSADPDGVVPIEDDNAEKRRTSEVTVATANLTTIEAQKQTTESIPEQAIPVATTGPSKAPPQSMLSALRQMNLELDENMRKFRSAESRQVMLGESTDMEDEFEEELVDEEVTVATEYEEEELIEEETLYEDSTVHDVARQETEDEGDKVDETKSLPEEPAASPDERPALTEKPSTDDASVTSQVSNSKLPPKKLRDFWEKKSTNQQNPRDFWESQSKRKKT
ncbi:expressed unknown protein [Seminavis robusta]|uniref:Uncharacterized protein n=1 Tax=Seminavis robusta TaxID=568900 RepID=A0A9N8EKI4_9STRA|nr:expressed unknown protein [Seminavis robusta]|eukprot:Sro1133_g244790.1 n/a (1046) ;mRNA; f:7102-10328